MDSAHDVARSVAYLPVIASPNTRFYYNNTLIAAVGCLGSIAQQTPPRHLMAADAGLLQ